MFFDLENAKKFIVLKYEKNIIFQLAEFWFFYFIFFIIIFTLFLYKFFLNPTNESDLKSLMGLSLLSLGLALISLYLKSFLNYQKKLISDVDLSQVLANVENYNLADFLDFDSFKACYFAKNFAKKFAINSSILFYFILEKNPNLNFIFAEALISLKNLKKILRKEIETFEEASAEKRFTKDFDDTILDSLRIAAKEGHKKIELTDLLVSLAKNNAIFKKILIENNLKQEDIENICVWFNNVLRKSEESKAFWEWKNLIKAGSLGKEWSVGYTLTLDQYSHDITGAMRKEEFREIFAHKEEVKRMEAVLSRVEKNNILIVGDSGSARKSMLEFLANKTSLGESLKEINYKKVVMLNMPSLLANTKTTEEAESCLNKIFQDVLHSGNIILAIDDLHNYIQPSRQEREPGKIDISGVLAHYLTYPSFLFIGITDHEGFHKNIEPNAGLMELFEKIEVSEISQEETLLILEDRALRLGYKYKIFIPFLVIKKIIFYGVKYFPDKVFPEKAMDILDEAAVFTAQRKRKVILVEDVDRIVSLKTKILVGEIEKKEKEILLNLESLIHQQIVNQEEAINEISSAMRRVRAGITVRKGPIGSFLFLGPTGVGKTETAKALAKIYFGSEGKMIRLDMSEFQEIKDIPRLIGSFGESGLLTTPVREHPFSIVLLDEIEKAHPNILNLFLQILDEGYITDGLGRKVYFQNTIIIATSNAGYQIILDAIKENADWSKTKEKLLTYIFDKGIFRPEFINRFDGIIVFKALTKENLLKISQLLLDSLKKILDEKEIEFIITEELKEQIVELGYDPTFGARNMQRLIQEKLGNPLASAILSGTLKRGDRVKIDPKEFKLLINES